MQVVLRLISRRHLTRASAIACVTVVLLGAAFAGQASAASYTYCDGCTIYGTDNGNNAIVSTNGYYITLDYVHRLSGPYCTNIGAGSVYYDYSLGRYVWGSIVLQGDCSTDVQHGYNGDRVFWGGAVNYGAGNYGFNAHVDY